MSNPRTEARVRLATHGFVTLHGVIAPRWLAHLERALEEALARPSPLGQQFARRGGAFHSDLFLSASFPAFRAFSAESDLAAIVAEATGLPEVVLFCDELLVKEPGTSLETPWHHDYTYWPVAGEEVYSVWIPLDRVCHQTGALEFVQGSHRWDQRYHPKNFDTGADRVTANDEQPVPDVDRDVAPADRAIAEVELGDCVLFHGRTLHRAAGNSSAAQRRRAIVVRLVGPDVRYDPRPRTLPLIWAPRLAPGQRLADDPLFPTLWPARQA
jgi:ectoine hydroxylase-related dioxygenase (phytanoyl-CoA dioxygenase family)